MATASAREGRFHEAIKSKELRNRIPSVAEISPAVAYELWQMALPKGAPLTKEKIFVAALGVALQLSLPIELDESASQK